MAQLKMTENLQWFENQVRDHFGLVYAIAFARLRNREAAEDCAQEVFLWAFLKRDNLKFPHELRGWLVTVARNLSEDWRRTQRRSSKLLEIVILEKNIMESLPAAPLEIRQNIDARRILDRAQEAILNLPMEQREIILLH